MLRLILDRFVAVITTYYVVYKRKKQCCSLKLYFEMLPLFYFLFLLRGNFFFPSSSFYSHHLPAFTFIFLLLKYVIGPVLSLFFLFLGAV